MCMAKAEIICEINQIIANLYDACLDKFRGAGSFNKESAKHSFSIVKSEGYYSFLGQLLSFETGT